MKVNGTMPNLVCARNSRRAMHPSFTHSFLLSLAAVLAWTFTASPLVAQYNSCRDDDDCRIGELCVSGECKAGVCAQVYQPVCGANGKTYSNACQARLAHVEVASQGRCSGPGGEPGPGPTPGPGPSPGPGDGPPRPPRPGDKVCGGIAGRPCDESEFCDPDPGFCRGRDIQGICVERPHFCPEIYRPVCGCDGRTYANDCQRVRAEVPKDRDGACRPSPQSSPVLMLAGQIRSGGECPLLEATDGHTYALTGIPPGRRSTGLVCLVVRPSQISRCTEGEGEALQVLEFFMCPLEVRRGGYPRR